MYKRLNGEVRMINLTCVDDGRGYSMPYRIFSNIPGSSVLDITHSPSVSSKKCHRRRQNCFLLRSSKLGKFKLVNLFSGLLFLIYSYSLPNLDIFLE